MTPEKEVQNSIVKYINDLQKEGYCIYVERRQAGGVSYKKGICDLYVIFNSIHIEVEVKQEKGHLSTMQEKWRDKCKKLNIPWVCCYNLEDFINFINDLENNFLSL